MGIVTIVYTETSDRFPAGFIRYLDILCLSCSAVMLVSLIYLPPMFSDLPLR